MKKPEMKNMAVAFPDEGAYKRFHLMFEQEFPLITCIRIKKGGRVIVKIKEGKIFFNVLYAQKRASS